MSRFAWMTDLHLSFAVGENRESFLKEVADSGVDGLLIGGDLGEANNVERFLRNIVEVFELSTYVVLGNHDFYGGSITQVRESLGKLAQETPLLTYLTSEASPIFLSERTALIGHDGWADGREGSYAHSLVMLNDYRLIKELASLSKDARLRELHRLGDESAMHIRQQLEIALPLAEEVIVLTHVPPLRDACWYNGKISDDDWAPHFVCRAMGDAILDMATQFPRTNITVLCGHTHSGGQCEPLENLRIITGEAEYGSPTIADIIEID